MGTNLLKPIYGSKPYKLFFISSAIKDWKNLDDDIRDSKSKNIFKNVFWTKLDQIIFFIIWYIFKNISKHETEYFANSNIR